jgi:hypothetical protein
MFLNITQEIIQDLVAKNKIQLYATHSKLCLPIINRIYKKMAAGIDFSAIKVENNLICDGHHRYVASLLADFPLEKISGSTTSATQVTLWTNVFFDEEDWDTLAKIKMLNEQDATYNNISIEKISELLK